jgi:dihydrofolate reductase
MRIVTYGAACSLDMYIAGPNAEIDWLHMSADVERVMAEYWKTIDTILMGRKTWEFAQAMAAGGQGDVPEHKGITTYIFSRTLASVSHPGAQLVREDAGEFVRALKKKKGKGIMMMGGGELARSLFDAGVIDEVGCNIHPILLGGGIPMFPAGGRQVKLKLKDSRELAGGCVLANYKVRT